MKAGVRSRYGGSKVRTGCKTCKMRHLKCDEVRPVCLRCTKSGQTCAGYPNLDMDAQKKPKHLVVIQYTASPGVSPQTLTDIDSRQKRSLDFFCKCTAPELADPFPSQLWYEFVQLAIDGQNPVRHAVLALAGMHEHYIRDSHNHLSEEDYPMVQYKRAIQQVCQLDGTKHEHAFDFALAACVLFSCIEGIRGHYQSLLSHLRSGMRIMIQTGGKASSTKISHLSREMLQQLFIGVNAQLMASGSDCLLTGACTPNLTHVPDAFDSACRAMSALEQFYCELMHLYLSLKTASTNPTISDQQRQSFLNQHEAYKHYFNHWTRSCMSILCLRSPTSPALFHKLSSEALVVLITSISVSIALEVDLSDAEMDIDRFEPRFQQILMACEEFLNKQSMRSGHTSIIENDTCSFEGTGTSVPRAQPVPVANMVAQGNVCSKIDIRPPPTFSMRLGVVPHLYWAASRCRDPMIRRWALRLLLTCNRREGLWDSTTCGRIAERVILIEENAAISCKSYLASEDQRTLTSSSDVVRRARVTVLWAEFEAGNTIRICYSNLQNRSETVETFELPA